MVRQACLRCGKEHDDDSPDGHSQTTAHEPQPNQPLQSSDDSHDCQSGCHAEDTTTTSTVTKSNTPDPALEIDMAAFDWEEFGMHVCGWEDERVPDDAFFASAERSYLEFAALLDGAVDGARPEDGQCQSLQLEVPGRPGCGSHAKFSTLDP